MGESTKIEWCHHTFNPWWGCTRVSPGCGHCYAETFDKRIGGHHWGAQSERRTFGDKHWAEPLKWDREAAAAGERRRVFCASMADIFEDHPALEPHRQRLWELIANCLSLDWLLLTKRPENFGSMLPWRSGPRPPRTGDVATVACTDLCHKPWPHVWLGVTAEDQQRADERVPVLLSTPAAVRFMSYEPALGPVDLRRWLEPFWWSPDQGPDGTGGDPPSTADRLGDLWR